YVIGNLNEQELMNLFKNDTIEDPFFGKMNVVFDKFSNSFFLDKKITLDGVSKAVILYIETNNKESSQEQRFAFKKITKQFLIIWQAIKDFLVTTNSLLNENSLENNYRIESITLPKNLNFNRVEWELELLNLEDGFSKIVVEIVDTKPVHFSVEG
ncbi:hypothetical protein I5M27_18480, partial [Adhaeribacter sp. BT258]